MRQAGSRFSLTVAMIQDNNHQIRQSVLFKAQVAPREDLVQLTFGFTPPYCILKFSHGRKN